MSNENPQTAPCKVMVGCSFMCPCGTEQPKLDGWVAAHWDESLVGNCKKCGTEFNVRSGMVRIVKRGKVVKGGAS